MIYHSHQTISLNGYDKQEVDSIRRMLGMKITTIGSEAMLTKYYKLGLEDIKTTLKCIEDILPMPVTKTKIECESLSLDKTIPKDHYRECHIKLKINNYKLDAALIILRLAKLTNTFDWHVSNNPNESKAGYTIQFVNFRFSNMSVPDSEKIIVKALKWIEDRYLTIVEVKRELVVYDV